MSILSDFIQEQGLDEAARADEFRRIVQALDLFIPEALQPGVVERLRQAVATAGWDAWDAALSAVCEGQDLVFNRRWRFTDSRSLRAMLEEVVVREEYFVPQPLPPVPVFIDCGANIGLATYFMRRRHPTARIIAYEPNPEMFSRLEANVARNAYADITLHQAAVGGSARRDRFLARADAPMVGRLVGPDQGAGTPVDVVRAGTPVDVARAGTPIDVARAGTPVDVVPLSAILQGEPEVDLLKVDIEGAEAEAIPEADALLRRCRFIFVECHMNGREAGGGTLLPVLNTLARQGFAFHVGRSGWSERQHGFRPLRHAHQAYSSGVYATRLD